MNAPAIPALARAPAERRGLVYPFGTAAPDAGTVAEVAPGVLWLRMPLPFALDHINLWLLDGGDHWALVDTGLGLPDVARHWRRLLAGPLAGKPIGRLVVTHYHPDHIGLAGWLAREAGVCLETSRGEYFLARALALDASPTPPPEVVAFYRAHGWREAELTGLTAAGWGGYARGVSPLPAGFRRLQPGDQLRIGGRVWQVWIGAGHSPEHVCLFCPAERILIAGDQLLPRITSNVSVYPTEPEANPLADWLESLARLQDLPEETLVLPAHNEPFLGLHARARQIEADHRRRLERLADALRGPTSARETLPTLFGRPIAATELMMATGEAVAHLNWLVAQGLARRARQEGRFVFQAVS
ncbi:MAG: MBL fold metallo-hydrolase [Sphingomonadaceae bacterium]|uniref:MBL fold metallo-hydrolase n=1 Tax=Thermaurantiacus sp. TaxID=2820283 RepID=UPI00298F0251|nr:MBL fold metallo-hydrolase [Thermaurantiacus sp.]MCS6987609.1 MBL fold metallo-hydrolase [Sphingomonadaceae bacterium]MDW8415210.1 MBL fold metallo-hydrolase [Thermaurantiacus sp.]